MNSTAFLMAGLVLGLSPAMMASAQDAAAGSGAGTSADAVSRANRFIEEIVVTAQKREENLQDVPISVAAFSDEALDARGIVDAKDLQLVTPGLQYGTTSGFSVIYLRGVGSDAFIPSADASVATYVDGVYFPFTHAQAQAFGTVERVEVLKGPQGTLFGRNSTGGAISVITKDPGQFFESSAQLGYGSFDAWQRRLYTNLPLTDELAMNLGAIYNTSDSYYDHLTQSLPQNVTRGVRGKLRWTPVDALDVIVGGYRMEENALDSLLVEQLSPKPLLAILNPRETGEYETAASEAGFLTSDTTVFTAHARLAMPWFDTKFIGSLQNFDTLAATDFDATEYPLVSYTAVTFADIETAELQFLSNDSSWGHDWLTWIAGLYFIHSEAGFEPIGLRAGPNLPDVLDNLLPDAGRLVITGVLDTESVAEFFQATAEITDTIALTVGGRYQTETRKLIRASSALDLGAGDVTLIPFADQSTDSSNFSPKAVIDFKPVPGTLLYLSWTKGFKSGTYNIVSIVTPPDYIKPEKVTTVEAGIKADLLDGAMRLNAAVFNNEIDELQTQIVSLQSGASVAFENAGSARIRGAEFDLSWFPLPDALPGLALTASGSYLDSKYTDFDNASGYDETTGLFFGPGSLTQLPGRDFTGNRVVRTPKYSGNAGLSYSFSLAAGEMELAADAYYNDGIYYTAQNSPRAEEGSYTVVNARISYLYTPWDLRVTVYGKNINDGRYYLFQYESDFGTSGTQAPPANYGIRLNWTF